MQKYKVQTTSIGCTFAIKNAENREQAFDAAFLICIGFEIAESSSATLEELHSDWPVRYVIDLATIGKEKGAEAP